MAAVSDAAAIKFPNGEYQVAVEDLSVKVIGGSIAVTRTWMATDQNHGKWQWLFTPAWSDLQFTYDVVDNSVTAIKRAESPFVKNGSGVFVYGASGDKQAFIKQTDSGWRWYDTLGKWMTYDVDGKLTSYGDRNGTIAYFVRDQGRISNILDNRNDAANPVLTYHYTGNQLTSISDYSGRTVEYTYDASAQLVKVKDAVCQADPQCQAYWIYNYSGGLLTSWSDPEHGPDVKTSITYSGNRVVGITNPMGFLTTYDYSYDRGKQIYTIVEKAPAPSADQQSGVSTESHYDAGAKLIYRMIGSRVVYQLKKDGATEVEIDERGLQTRTTYDSQHNPIKVVYPDGTSVTRTYDGTYSNLTSTTDELGIQTVFAYDTHGNLTTKTEAVGKPEQRITTYTYDEKGQILTQTVERLPVPQGGDPNNTQYQDATVTWTYDLFGNVATAKDAMGHTTQFTVYDAQGDVKTKVDARGKTWMYAYNNRGQLTSQTDPLTHGAKYGYDKVGNRTGVTDALNYTTVSAYDNDNRLISITDPTEDDGTPGGVKTRSYFNDGRLKQTCDEENVCTTYGYDSDGRLITSKDADGNVTTEQYGDASSGFGGLLTSRVYPTYSVEYDYDAMSRQRSITEVLPVTGSDPKRQTTTYGFNARGDRISTVNPLGRATLTEYDALGRIVKSTNALSGVDTFTYDSRDNLLTVTDAAGHTHRFAYDLSGRLLSESRPSMETIQNTYDERGRLSTRTLAGGERLVATYDDDEQRIREDYYAPGSDTVRQTVTFAYDARGSMTGYGQSGDTQSAADVGYDTKGRRTTETVTFGAGPSAFSKTTRYTYFKNGMKKSFTYPDGKQTLYGYTGGGNLESVAGPDNAAIRFANFSWNTPRQVQYPGIVRNTEMDALERPLHIQAQLIGSGTYDAPAGAMLMDDQYAYNPVGSVATRITEAGEYDYSYDELNRLVSATPPAGVQLPSNQAGLPVERYTYDQVGNRTTSAHQPGPWVYNADNQLLNYGAGADLVTYTFDANGNTKTKKIGDPNSPTSARTFIYNAVGRLAEIDDGSSTTARYQYDPFGRRIQKNVAGQITWYQYSDEGLIAEYASDGTLLTTMGWRPGLLWSRDPLWQATVSGGVWSIGIFLNDHLGAPQRLVDSAGDLLWSANTEAFGRAVESQSQVSVRQRLPGQQYDSESGLHYNYFRDYDPITGRYLEADPHGISAGSNFYAYAEEQPLILTDVYGLKPDMPPPPIVPEPDYIPPTPEKDFCTFACALGEHLRKLSDSDQKEHCAHIGKNSAGEYQASVMTQHFNVKCDVTNALPPNCTADNKGPHCYTLHVHPLHPDPPTDDEKKWFNAQNTSANGGTPMPSSDPIRRNPKPDPDHPSGQDQSDKGTCLYTNNPKKIVHSDGRQDCPCP